MENTKLIRLPQVMAITGLSRSSIYSFIAKEEFPKPVRLGLRAVAWRLEGIEKWVNERQQVN